jgi:peptide/nickel transport system substrate-binding protein
MTWRERLVTGSCLVLLVVLGAAMAAPAVPGPAAALPTRPAAAPAEQLVVREGLIGPVETLNPLFVRTRAERDITALLFRGLTRLGPGSASGSTSAATPDSASGATLSGDLAESWTASSDGLTYTFQLRPDAVWHDGVPVTADDVVYTVLVLQHPDYSGPLAGRWQGVIPERLGDHTVRLRLPTPNATFLASTTQPILPAHLLSATPVAQLASSPFGRNPVGTGPFRLVSLDQNGARLERFGGGLAEGSSLPTLPPLPLDPLAWPRSATPIPSIAGFVFTFYPNAEALATAFAAGDIDAAGGLPAAQARSLAAAGGARILRYPRTVLTAVVLNLRFGRTLFRSAAERRALLLAIDRQAIVRGVLEGMGSAADSLVPPTSWAFNRQAAGGVPFSRTEAVKLLRAAGWQRIAGEWNRPGVAGAVSVELVTVDAATNPLSYAVAERVAAYWQTLGLKVRLQPLPVENLVTDKLVPGSFDAAVIDLTMGPDPDIYPLLASSQAVQGGSNISGYQSTNLDPLLEQARLPAGREARQARMAALEAALAKELPILPLVYADYVYLVRDTVSGPTPREISDPSERFWDVLTWRVAESAGP